MQFGSTGVERGAHLSASEMRLDRQALSKSAFQHSGNAFGSTGAEVLQLFPAVLECIWVDRSRARAISRTSYVKFSVWIDGRRARAHLNTPETDSERRAPRCCALGAGSTVFVVSESARRQKYYFCRKTSTGVSRSTVFVEPASSPAMEVLLLSSEMLGDAGSTLFALLSSIKWRPLFA